VQTSNAQTKPVDPFAAAPFGVQNPPQTAISNASVSNSSSVTSNSASATQALFDAFSAPPTSIPQQNTKNAILSLYGNTSAPGPFSAAPAQNTHFPSINAGPSPVGFGSIVSNYKFLLCQHYQYYN